MQVPSEVISTLRGITSSHVTDGCKKSDIFILMVDGTTDHSNAEIEAVVLR